MTYVSSSRKIADPANAYRIWKDFHPLLEGGIRFREPYWSEYQKVKKDAEEKIPGINATEIYYLTNKIVAENLHRLQGYKIIWAPGTSVNLTPEDNAVGAKPATLGMDWVSDVIRLPDDLLRATAEACRNFQKYYGIETKIYEKIKFIPVNPCAFWIWDIKKEGGWKFVPTFKEELKEISDYLTEKGKFGYETFERKLDLPDWCYEESGVVGNYEWSRRVADPHYHEDKLVKILTYTVRKTIGKACGTIAGKSTTDGITYAYMEKSKVEREMLNKMPKKWLKKIDFIGSDEPNLGIMRNTRKLGKITALAESHPTALEIYKGRIRYWAEQDYLASGGKLRGYERFSGRIAHI